MAEAAAPGLDPQITQVDPAKLKFDLRNFRMAEEEFGTENEVISHLIEEYDVNELVLSILTAGWLDYEPLIAERDGTVIEGNRRLAALKLIADPELRKAVGYSLPKVDPENPNARPSTIGVRYSDNRKAAYVYIGFKHINGPFKWDALAKAKFAADWVAEGHDIELVGRTLGDSHNTVLRLVNGWNVLQRARAEGFDPADATTSAPFPISHLYTALTRPDIRKYLGINTSAKEVIQPDAIDKEHTQNLLQLMSWLYGQRSKNEASIIKTQNPDLGNLVRVIAHDAAREELVANRDLAAAAELLTPSSERFEIVLRQAARACEDALAASKDYDGSPTLLDIVNNMGKTILTLRQAMQASKPDPLSAFADATPKS
ncbi:MAG: hypothetical protein E5X48_31045 [Mesorhizobium sp.]|uniref:hypothetical protein n=1 Tax=Mesorhizobium sp. TaxID=1871066 RepID=UPI00120A94F0|nr:hypothetical protein [Mesorhizobium sp.]TIQ28747.1 MAG: hypothetical protein E5X48_31045 [Mesorhizobium sp.]